MYPGEPGPVEESTRSRGVPRPQGAEAPLLHDGGAQRPKRPPGDHGRPMIAAVLLASAVAWQAPLPAPLFVERPFIPPAASWAPGHRGVDLAAAPDAPVRAAGSGRVVYTGRLAGRYVVSIEHAAEVPGLGSGWRTTYEGVRPRVQRGEAVAAGTVIGVLDTRGAHCRCLHWGLKRGTSYADPLLLLRRPIVLKP